MSPSKKSPIPAEKIALYEKLLAKIPGIEKERGEQSVHFSQRQYVFVAAKSDREDGPQAFDG